MQFNKLFLSISLLLIGAVWVACVDVPTGPGTNVNPNFRSMVRFVDLAPSQAAGVITVDGAAAGSSLSYLGNTGYLDLPAGSRSLAFGTSGAVTSVFGSEQQSTLVIYEVGTSVAFLNLVEGSYLKNNAIPGFARVKFINAANGAAANVAFRQDSATGTPITVSGNTTTGSVAFGAASQYAQVDPGSKTIFAVSSGGYTTGRDGINGTNAGTGAETKGTGLVDLTLDKGLISNVTLKSKNSEGFISTADIRLPDGSSLKSLRVKPQVMTFQTISLGGDQEVPPVTTTATGNASLTVTNDSSVGAVFTVTTTTPTSLGFWTAAHIHNAAAGVNGPVEKPIDVTNQVVSFPAITATGSATTATAACTFSLKRDTLFYSIEVQRDQFDTTFIAAHFHLSSGIVKNIITHAWSAPDTTLEGVWTSSDSTQPLTTVLVDSILAGNIYVNFHSIGRPAGLIRATLTPNATHTNTFRGTFTGTSFFNLKDQFAFSRMYFNFHTAVNPGGEIRGQAIPDTFSTSAYVDTLKVPPAGTDSLLNNGRLYYTFDQAGGQVRGNLAVDPTKGQYAVTSLSGIAFDAGRMYTLIATGKGASFQILKLDDRIFGVTKPATISRGTQTTSPRSE